MSSPSNKPLAPDDEIPPPHPVKRIIRLGIALLALAGMIYISGIHEALLLRRTPATVPAPAAENGIEYPAISIPVAVYLVQGPQGSTGRSNEDVRRIISRASELWQPAGITLDVTEVKVTNQIPLDPTLFFLSPRHWLDQLEPLAQPAITIIFTPALGGINGVAFTDRATVALADFTGSYDFRTLAHEIGHVLGLPHAIGNRGRLMNSGSNGTFLTENEITQARARATALAESQ